MSSAVQLIPPTQSYNVGSDVQDDENEANTATKLQPDPLLNGIDTKVLPDDFASRCAQLEDCVDGRELERPQDRVVNAQECSEFKDEPEIAAISGDPQTTTIQNAERPSTLDTVIIHENNTDRIEDAASQVPHSSIEAPSLQSDDKTGGTIKLEPDYAVCRVIEAAQGSAGKLVNLLAKHFSAFHDDARFEGRRVRFLKRAQIFVADVWAALRGAGRAAFDDVDQLTMFAGECMTSGAASAGDGPLHRGRNVAILSPHCMNLQYRRQCQQPVIATCRASSANNFVVGMWVDYRVPQMLQSLGVMVYSPPLEHHIRDRKQIAVGHSWELELR
jgi:hypothetical protein